MLKLLALNKSQKHLVQKYVNNLAVGIPAIFDFGFTPERPARKSVARIKTNQPKSRRRQQPKNYLLSGDGSFGGVVLHGLMVLRGKQYLFDEIQANNLHSKDSFIPERLESLTRLFKPKRFRRKNREDKSELNSNA